MIKPDTRAAERRAAEIARLYATGETLEKIGQRFGITRERVRQLLNQLPEAEADALRETNRASKQAEAAKRAQNLMNENIDQILALWMSGKVVEEIREELGLPTTLTKKINSVIDRWYGPNARLERANGRRVENRRYLPDKLVLMHIQMAASELGESLTLDRYDEWADRQDFETLTSGGIILRFTNWSGACRLAGVKVSRNFRRSRRDRFSESACIGALVRVARQLNRIPSQSQYERNRLPDDPSVLTVRKRLGGWVKARRAVSAALGSDQLAFN